MSDVYEKRDMILREFERFVQEYSVAYTDYNEEVLKATHELLGELLKAQEPRVMTLEEVNAVRKDGKNIVWIEGWQGEDKPWLPKNPIDDYCRLEQYLYKGNVTAYEFGDDIWDDMPPKNYGKTWRVWTSRPTEAQREAVKWDG